MFDFTEWAAVSNIDEKEIYHESFRIPGLAVDFDRLCKPKRVAGVRVA